VRSNDAERDNWTNASVLLNNCFAISNMQRHRIEDVDKRAAVRNQRFLSRVNPEAARTFDYLNHLMVSLKEEIDEGEFREQLKRYLEEFFHAVELM